MNSGIPAVTLHFQGQHPQEGGAYINDENILRNYQKLLLQASCITQPSHNPIMLSLWLVQAYGTRLSAMAIQWKYLLPLVWCEPAQNKLHSKNREVLEVCWLKE